MSSPLQHIEQTVRAQTTPDPAYTAFRAKTTELEVLGTRLPVLHKIMKDGFAFYEQSTKDVLNTWNEIWNTSNIHEVLYLPLLYYRWKKTELDPTHWKIMKQWADRIENWEHADALSYLYSLLHESYPYLLYPTLKKWNRSSNPWKQRLSIVSLIYYASPNRTAPPLSKVLPLVEPLIGHEDLYVNKAVGWTLREAYKLYPAPTLTFIKKQIGILSTDGYSYATEKVDKQMKQELKWARALAKRS